MKTEEKLMKNKEQILVEFSVHELKEEYEKQNALFKTEISY